MDRSLQELLGSDILSSIPGSSSEERDAFISNYLSKLSSLSLAAVQTEESQSLAQASQSVLRSLQALAARSHKAIVESSDVLSQLSRQLPSLGEDARELREQIPKLEDEVGRFSQAYCRNAENAVLERRRKALLLTGNVDRLSDILELPSLLSTAISSSNPSSGVTSASATGSSVSGLSGYSSALDIYSHIKRLHHLHPTSSLVSSVVREAEECMERMRSSLVLSLRSPGLKLPAAIRIVGWLRRVAPEGGADGIKVASRGSQNREGGYGALFLVCRLGHLNSLLEALEPLRELADHEIEAKDGTGPTQDKARAGETLWSSGQHTERYLKRYIEIFREQSFAIVSMYRSIFPAGMPEDVGLDTKAALKSAKTMDAPQNEASTPSTLEPLQPLPSALSTFPLHLVDVLMTTLRRYLPGVRDRSARESLMTQLLYCAASLGRLGSDFSPLLASLSSAGPAEDDAESGLVEWVEVVKKHRALAGRLDLLASGLATSSRGKS